MSAKFTKEFFTGKRLFSVIFILIFLFCLLVYLNELNKINKNTPKEDKITANILTNGEVSVTVTLTPSPTPKPLTFAEMNARYGPCTQLPVLMYHHIQSKEEAIKKHQASLTVYDDFFKAQMEYLKSKNYSVLGMADLVDFFNNSKALPKKPVLLTFDDAYGDFYTDAFPVLKQLNFKATVFTPTGLVENSGYLSWNQIAEMGKSGIEFSNHTWSHKNVTVASDIFHTELLTADTQLAERNLNSPKVFAYPYGLDSTQAELFLKKTGYQLAFTTKSGSVLCKKSQFDLPRIRIGNAPLTAYGF